MSQRHLTETRFDNFDLDSRILQAIEEAGFTYCTPIQAETLPLALAGEDVAGQAQTGTGKTAAYLVATIARLLKDPEDSAPEGASQRRRQPRAIMLAPTRELAVQIHADAVTLSKYTDLKLGLVYGGTGYIQQRDQIEAGVDILIGTPGRLIDYFKQRVFDMHSVEVVVLDEADRMFDLGFIKDIRFVLRRMPPAEKRLGLLFSATLSYRVTELAYEHMNDPRMVEIQPEQVTAERVTQRKYMVANDEKISLLIGLLRTMPEARVMVFVNTKRVGEAVWGFLEGNGLHAAMLSGDVPQPKRLKLLKKFTDGDLPIMVATDVAARGLHIADVTHVINYDLPEDAEDYVHRIGRTARAGAKGDAISFLCESYALCMPEIEKYIGMPIPTAELTNEMFAEIDHRSRVRVERPDRDDRGRGGPRGRGRDRGGRRDGGGGRHRSRRHDDSSGDKPSEGADQSAGPGNKPEASANANEAEKKPRRKRRPRRRGPKVANGDAATQEATAPATPAPPSDNDAG